MKKTQSRTAKIHHRHDYHQRLLFSCRYLSVLCEVAIHAVRDRTAEPSVVAQPLDLSLARWETGTARTATGWCIIKGDSRVYTKTMTSFRSAKRMYLCVETLFSFRLNEARHHVDETYSDVKPIAQDRQ